MKNITLRTICDEETMRTTYPGRTLYPCVDCGLTICLDIDREEEAPNGEPVYCCHICKANNNAERIASAAHSRDWIDRAMGLRTAADALPKITPTFADRLPSSPYALRLTGNALAPRLKNGAVIVIDPTIRVIKPGDAVLAHVTATADRRAHSGVYFINADGDLSDNRGAHHAFGNYRLGGVVTEIDNPKGGEATRE